jgi:hypothetical protein
MSKLTIAAATIALALAGGPAFADDNSMSQWTGDSYKAFEAARISADKTAHGRQALNASPENGMSQFNGDSYAAFESARKSPESLGTTVAEVRPLAKPSHEAPAHTAAKGRSYPSPFRDDTAA